MPKADFHLSRTHTIEHVSRISSRIERGTTLYMPPGETIEEVAARIRISSSVVLPDWLISDAQASKTGFCLFSGSIVSLLVPPFPVHEDAIFQGFEIEPILAMLQKQRLIGIVLVRLGAYGVGVCRGETLVASKVGTGLVHGRHRQGGSSSQRFRRRRENQIDGFLDRVCEKIREHLGEHLREMEFITYGGARTTIELLKEQCRVLQTLKARELPPLLDIEDPRQPILEAAVGRIWSSRIVEWSPDSG